MKKIYLLIIINLLLTINLDSQSKVTFNQKGKIK
jgi:hypothetical protein